jgi:integrase
MAAVQQTLEHCQPTLWRMIVLQMVTGMRSSELCTMRPMDIETSGDVWLYRVQQHKGSHRGHQRQVALGPRAQEVLGDLLRQKPADAFLFTPGDAEADRGVKRRPDAARPLQARYDAQSYYASTRHAIRRAGAAHWHAHQLRHLAGTVARDAAGLEGAQALLGHRHARVTEVYAELAANRAGVVAAMVG